jgi:hypothetical protein
VALHWRNADPELSAGLPIPAASRPATIPVDGPTGTFVDEDGTVPW